MQTIYRYMVCALLIALPTTLSAQDVITDQLVYDRVSGYMTTEQQPQPITKQSKNYQDIRWQHNIRIGYGAPGIVQTIFHDGISWSDYTPSSVSDRVHNSRYYWGPTYALQNLMVEYDTKLNSWLSIGFKGSFAATWQARRNAITNDIFYRDDYYSVGALLTVRFEWLRREWVQMYSAVGVGAAIHIERANGMLWPMGDITLWGMSVGKGFYGFIEIGEGISGSARAGIGFRFNSKR